MVRVVAISGMPGAGKGVFGQVAIEMGFIVRSMGDMIRAEVEARDLDENPHIFGRIAQELRDKYGYGVLATRLVGAINKDLETTDIVVIEGMRGDAERNIFAEAWGDDFGVLAIDSSIDARFQRILARGRAEDGDRATFEERDERECGWGLGLILKQANWRLSNEGEIKEFKDASKAWLFSHCE
jgi:dephospho-CoA kinase